MSHSLVHLPLPALTQELPPSLPTTEEVRACGRRLGPSNRKHKLLLCLICDVGREIDVKEGRFVNRLGPKAAGDLSVRFRKNVKATTKQRPVGFDPHEIFTIGKRRRMPCQRLQHLRGLHRGSQLLPGLQHHGEP
jgi:hypothetical protein